MMTDTAGWEAVLAGDSLSEFLISVVMWLRYVFELSVDQLDKPSKLLRVLEGGKLLVILLELVPVAFVGKTVRSASAVRSESATGFSCLSEPIRMNAS